MTGAHRSRVATTRAVCSTSASSLPHHDCAGHRCAVHCTVVLIGPRCSERHGVHLTTATYDRTARKRSRPLRPDAVGDAQIVGPGPGHGGTHRHCVDRRVGGAVVGAAEHDSPVIPHGHGPDRAHTATPATAAPAATPAAVWPARRVPAAPR